MENEKIKQMSLYEYKIGYASGQAKVLTNFFLLDASSEELKIQAMQEIINNHLICAELLNQEIALLVNELYEIMDSYRVAVLFATLDHFIEQQREKIDLWEKSPWKEGDYYSFLRLKNTFLIEHCEKLNEKLSIIKNIILK